MATEFLLYKLSDIQKVEKNNKIRQKLSTQTEKMFNNIIEKEADEDIKESLENLSKKFSSLIEKEVLIELEGIPICTVTSKKTYIEMPLKELEQRMSEKSYVIIDDDGNKYKSTTNLKKFYE